MGAECLCIGSGRCNEIGDSWWDTVGAQQRPQSRFPNGLVEVLDPARFGLVGRLRQACTNG